MDFEAGKNKKAGVESPVQMQVLCVGLPRTGTLSMKLALEQLYPGCQVLHMPIMDPSECQLWIKAIHAKFARKGKLFEKDDFKALLKNYGVRYLEAIQ
jgi:hypothetical protein